MRPRQGREDMKVQNIKTNASAHGNEAARKKYYCELNRDNTFPFIFTTKWRPTHCNRSLRRVR